MPDRVNRVIRVVECNVMSLVEKSANRLPAYACTSVRGESEVQFCTTERPQLFEFEVASCRTCRLRSKKAILEVATSNLQKRGFAQSWGPCMPI